MILHCPQCQSESDELTAKIEKKFLPQGGYHLTARCPHCNAFIKNLPHSRPEILYFGKHKGKPIAVIAREDRNYLEWLLRQDIKESLKEAIEHHLGREDEGKSQGSLAI